MAGRRFTTLCGPHGPAKLDLLSRGCNGHTSFVRKLTTAALKRRLLTTDQVNSSFCRRRWLHKTPVSQSKHGDQSSIQFKSSLFSTDIPHLQVRIFVQVAIYRIRIGLVKMDISTISKPTIYDISQLVLK